MDPVEFGDPVQLIGEQFEKPRLITIAPLLSTWRQSTTRAPPNSTFPPGVSSPNSAEAARKCSRTRASISEHCCSSGISS